MGLFDFFYEKENDEEVNEQPDMTVVTSYREDGSVVKKIYTAKNKKLEPTDLDAAIEELDKEFPTTGIPRRPQPHKDSFLIKKRLPVIFIKFCVCCIIAMSPFFVLGKPNFYITFFAMILSAIFAVFPFPTFLRWLHIVSDENRMRRFHRWNWHRGRFW